MRGVLVPHAAVPASFQDRTRVSDTAQTKMLGPAPSKVRTARTAPCVPTHLISNGFSLKEVGDHLGHASTESTQIYAKVNLSALREVAALDLKQVIHHVARSERKSTPVYRRGDLASLREVARISLEGLS